MARVGGIELEDRDVAGQFPGRSLSERERSARPGENDLGSFGLSALSHRERQRCVSEDSGDHESLAVEDSHVANLVAVAFPSVVSETEASTPM